MRRLFVELASLAVILLVLATQHADARKRSKRGRNGDDSEECDEYGNPLRPRGDAPRDAPPPRALPDVNDAAFMDFWPLGISQGVQEWEKDDFWPEMDDKLAEIFKLLMKGGDFGIKKGWEKDWSLDELEREMKRKMIQPAAAEEIIQAFRANEKEYRRMMEKMRRPREQHKPRDEPPYKLITVVLCAVLAVVLLSVLGAVLYRKAGSRTRVAPPTEVIDSSAKYEVPPANTGEKEPLPPCPAYMIAGAPPPVYSMAAAPSDGCYDNGCYDTLTPPTYSTIDLQNESNDAAEVTVKTS